jgi:hypothetical protein
VTGTRSFRAAHPPPNVFLIFTTVEGIEVGIASKEVDDRGIAEAYRAVYTTIQAHPDFGMDPFEVKLVGRQNPIARDLLDVRGVGVTRIATRSRRPRLGHLSVEETYVYAS